MSFFDYGILFVFFLLLFSEIMSGVSRYYLSTLGLTPLIYVPKMLILLIILVIIMHSIWRAKINKIYLIILLLFAIFACVGLYYAEGGSLQVAFGGYVLMIFFFGIIALPSFIYAESKLKPYIIALWLLAIIGVLLDYYYTLPWTGSEYQFVGANIEGSRQWVYLGVERLAGFGRISFATAIQILLLGIFLVVMIDSWWFRMFIWLIGGGVIVLTTTKTVVGVYIALTLFIIFRTLLPHVFWRSVLILIALIGIAMPVSTLIYSYQIRLDSYISEFVFMSFGMRFMNIWPQAFELVENHGSLLLGRGIGGIGSAQIYFEPFLSNPGDNLYLYLYLLSGFGMFPFIWAYVRWAGRLDLHSNSFDILFFMIAMSVLLEGWTVNLIESPVFALFFGLSFRYVFLKKSNLNFNKPHSL
ncbi:hypothetical protein [Candidatus Venteria ishoeyi]|uniref:O-Antigen ligase n=1 Tax=Candidatus Venteria ishoeyi TaxID=1899563 RepID=A0A1H6FHS2_9GAMM|nr:hypothetical protein [Candidatus Venteria ishoeyi]SEH08554.1 Uncharacterised protein [Candidatus Venteria ishoeyi]